MNSIPNNFPIKLDSPRVWRTYIGGKMLDEMHGNSYAENGSFPEEWIASCVRARNPGREHITEEGYSHVYGTQIRLKDLIQSDLSAYLGRGHEDDSEVNLGVLVKLIDSYERLTVQVHPTREKAQELFNSAYGKTECWYILGGQEVNGQKPCIYFGFKQGISREKWKDLFDRQDIPGMLNSLERFEVKPGDVIFIEGGIPHAIGAGCFLVEIQEPTDYTIRIERTTPQGLTIDENQCHQGLGFERMFDCFEYESFSREQLQQRWFIQPQILFSSDDGIIRLLVGPDNTSLFRMEEITVTKALKVDNNRTEFSGLYVLEGSGYIKDSHGRIEAIESPSQFFVPAATGDLELYAGNKTPLKIIRFSGPRRMQ